MMRRILMIILGTFFTLTAHAHKPSDSYLSLNVRGNTIAGQWDIALRDLDFAIGIDSNGDAAITWGEVRAKQNEIAALAMSKLKLSVSAQSCSSKVYEHLIDQHTDGAYAVLRFNIDCPTSIEVLDIQYALFFDIDPQHKGLLRLQYEDNVGTGIFSPDKSSQQFTLGRPSKWTQFLDYGREGVWHIWIGFDHILFLLALLLPAVVYRHKKWEPVTAFRPVFWAVFKIVSAFTVAHSITLTLATLGLISLPSRLVESVIAASVVIAALNNIFPLFRERRWAMAFVFGLIHGFGFASVLVDLGLPKGALILALIGFNLGVETGQLCIVAVFLPIAFILRHTWIYRKVILLGGSLLIAALALIWFAERAFELKLLPI